MTRRRRKSSKTKTNKPPRASPIKLDPKVWVRSGKSITDYRESLLLDQEGVCAISGLPLTDSSKATLDHQHAGGSVSSNGNGVDGKCRGVIESQINLLEGRYLKLFKKTKLDVKYGLTFPEFLINMGKYLQQDNSNHLYHYGYMSDLRKHISRLRKDKIVDMLLKDFNIVVKETTEKRELVRLYIQAFVDLIEEKEKR